MRRRIILDDALKEPIKIKSPGPDRARSTARASLQSDVPRIGEPVAPDVFHPDSRQGSSLAFAEGLLFVGNAGMVIQGGLVTLAPVNTSPSPVALTCNRLTAPLTVLEILYQCYHRDVQLNLRRLILRVYKDLPEATDKEYSLHGARIAIPGRGVATDGIGIVENIGFVAQEIREEAGLTR
jgi:hypothetical protein